MDILAWVYWGLSSVLGLVWAVFWFLIGGWVSTLLQIAVVIGGIFVFKYGWQRAPGELLAGGRSALRFFLGWVRKREPAPAQGAASGPRERAAVRVVRRKEPGDVNLSTAMSLLMLSGLLLVAAM